MMYANSLLIVQARNYTESVLHICLFQGDSGLTYSKSILVNRCKCTVQLTADTGRELSTPLVLWNVYHCKSYLLCKLIVVPLWKQYLEPLQ